MRGNNRIAHNEMIERKGSPTPAPDMMAEDAGGGEAPENDQGQTATLPLSIVGGQQVNEGDVIRLKVVSVDENAGSINVAYEHPAENDMGGSDMMASKFKKPSQKEGY